ncbi:MAG: N-acetyl-gamma-glutamyl-phosphate reductase [Planctomycetes bacterium]|nr:N-acetyl-gamma-glutamyl-phosphate reductase [Planctomycetota bacterium]
MAKIKIGIVGATGYIGSDLMRIASTHPNLEIAWVTSESKSGTKVHELFPNLRGYVRDEFRTLEPEMLGDVDAVALCLPHGGAMELMPTIAKHYPKLKVVDCSGDFRSPDIAMWEKFYDMTHRAADLQARFTYGLTEFNRDAIRKAQWVANPGCFATCIQLALAPFARHGQLRGNVHVSAITGSSGSGNKPSSTTHHPERAQNVRAYKVLEHQHLVEIVPYLESLNSENDFEVFFVPHSGPFVRGIFATCFIPLNERLTMASVDALIRDTYENEWFVQIVSGTPDMRLVQHTNHAMLTYRASGNVLVGMCVIDNMVKGGAGQAIQNLNLMLGLDEKAGLATPGAFV